MPCFMREKSISYVSRRDKQNDRDAMAPRPVHPRALSYHGFLGEGFVRQHLVVDERWTPNSLSEQFSGMSALLDRHAIFKRLETKANRQRFFTDSKRLKLQCRLGRTKLLNIVTGDNTHNIRNLLIKHRDMQRLYQRMPIHLVVDNINQRTFVLRKERDRLECRLGQLKSRYRKMLIDRAFLENRIKYQNEFVLEEEVKSQGFIKRIENSNIRLKAIKVINSAYQKMVQVLLQDEIFYEPIIRSLADDMEDQANFIKHILYLGMPAIAKFRELNFQYRQLEIKSRKNLLEKQQMLASLANHKPAGSVVPMRAKPQQELSATADPKRYLRETRNMLLLKNVLKVVEEIIKEVKFGTLCSQAREIYPRMKSQMENNENIRRIAEREVMTRYALEDRMKLASVLQGVLVNNLSEEEINRLEYIKDLRKSVKEEENIELEIMEYLKNRGDAFIMFRLSLWNLIEILRHVDRSPKTFRVAYPNSYLKLPLLKFDMLTMYAAPPELYEEDLEKVMHVLKRKVYRVMKLFNADMEASRQNCKEKYHSAYLATVNTNEFMDDDEDQTAIADDDIIQDQKIMANVPNRKQIKMLSSRVVEQAVRREEQ
ncbi:uncharacterized protein LOC115761611 [Drosophila novamexicana]|uniref:uncharacterized protein LOC115761611 n=1 Tax=Drosophila novamexicana TaxID=47314 RepID=UPI0011E60849|nr:uncharacterized protein LOC115761611 [Drosophila novamexicana]